MLYICVHDLLSFFLTLLTWTVDPRLQAEEWTWQAFTWPSVLVGCGQSELSPSVYFTHTNTHRYTIPSYFYWLVYCISLSLFYTQCRSASGCPVCCGHVSGLLFRGSVVSGRKKGKEGVVVGRAHIDSYPLVTRQEAAFIILPPK